MKETKVKREEAILYSLMRLDYLSRSQIQRLHNLSGDRNARRIMQALGQYVSSFRGETGENIYYLNKAGRERVGCEVVRSRASQANHYLMRNDSYLHYSGAEDWRNEMSFPVKDVLTVICDAYFRFNGRRHFLEVDHLQSMAKNREKVEKYKKLYQTGVLQERIKYFPRLVWVTMTEGRRKQLLEWCNGLDVVVHLWDEIR